MLNPLLWLNLWGIGRFSLDIMGVIGAIADRPGRKTAERSRGFGSYWLGAGKSCLHEQLVDFRNLSTSIQPVVNGQFRPQQKCLDL